MYLRQLALHKNYQYILGVRDLGKRKILFMYVMSLLDPPVTCGYALSLL